MKKIIFILLLNFLFPEKFIYSAGFKFINVGEATIESNINDDNDIVIHTTVMSNKFLDKLYKVRDNIKLIVNPIDFSLKKIEKQIVEGKWEKNYIAEIDSNFNVVTKDKIINNDKVLFDPISVVYSLRNKNLITGDKHEYNILGIDEIKVPAIFVGRSLRDLNLRKNYLVNVLAAGPTKGLTVNPPATYVLENDHVLVVMGLMEDLHKLPKI